MDSGQRRGKIFIIFGIILIIVIIVVTALKNKTPKADDGSPTLFEGIKNLTKNTTETITDYLGEEVKKIIPLELKDLDENSDGIPNVLKLSTTPSVSVTLPEESYGAPSPDLPQVLPFPRIITMQNGTINRITISGGKPNETLLAIGDTPELFDGTFGNNLTTVVARARTLTTLSHYLGALEKNTKNYCPYLFIINKKNTYTTVELEQLYGILEVTGVITSTFPPFTDYKTNAQDLVKAYQIKNNLSKKPTGILDTKTLDMLSYSCSEITKDQRRKKGEQIPDFILTYRVQSGAVEDILASKDSNKGAILLNTSTGISIGSLTDVVAPKTYTQIFASPFTDFNIEYPNNQTIIATTRPATGYSGVSYMFDIKTGKRTTLLEDTNGLMTLVSPDGNYTIYSTNDNDQALVVLNNKTFTAQQLPFTTIPDKCTWTHDSQHVICGVPVDGAIPAEDWLKGVTGNDQIKSYDIATKIVNDLPQPQEEVDVFKGIVSSENNYFGFINRKTMEPWMVSLIDFINN